MRVAAVGDLHVVPGSAFRLRPLYQRAALVADVLLLAGDLTNDGELDSAAELCTVVRGLDLPVVAVLGNHDHDAGEGPRVAAMLGDAGAIVLDGTAATIGTAAGPVGVAGVTGFADNHLADGGPGGRTPEDAAADAFHLRDALASLDTDVRIALTHYAPVRETLTGEAPGLHRFLGSSLLGAAIDGSRAAGAGRGTGPGRGATAARRSGMAGTLDPPGPASVLPSDGPAPAPADGSWHGSVIPGSGAGAADAPATALAVHGHAHHGQETGRTPGGTPVRNVARPVIVAPFAVYQVPGGARIG
ncbi:MULTISPECIES: metallophosphoesterase [unclassified Parafrankia]|uniref:metallophosphoesterase family protein n=1 Tax=unclassified Parafrankia TaxID=2994368 RepID=UPI000DA5CD5C|nr:MULTISPECIES: metallophosphoesterase [unclassified Parafrankia]TCJ40684.1 metallophosphoesterase [Parafrankia sp. BMG5.11]SQD99242.1 Metallophosphoesterase [Parafrankia sp. Ea1.12]